jgi:hypothetical protein
LARENDRNANFKSATKLIGLLNTSAATYSSRVTALVAGGR